MYVIRINLGPCHTLFMWTISKYDGNIFTISLILLLHQKVMQYQKYVIKQKWWFYIVWTPIPPFKKGGINFNHLPWRGGGERICKTKKGGGSMVQGQASIFSMFIIFIFRNYLIEDIIFFCQHNFMKKDHSKLSKNEPENIP